jgi:hypothetical protein
MVQMQLRYIKSIKNISSFLMAFSLLKDLSIPSIGRVTSDVRTHRPLCHNKRKKNGKKRNTITEKEGKQWWDS